MSGSEDEYELIEFATCDIASCDGSKFTTSTCRQRPGVAEGWHHRMFLPTNCNLCHWFAIHWSGPSSVPFKPEAGIRLQRAIDTTATLVHPTGTTTTGTGVCADALDTHGIGVLAGLLKSFESQPRHQDLVLPVLIWHPFTSMLYVFQRIKLSCSSSTDSIQRWRPCHLHIGFPKEVQCETLWRRLPEASAMNSRGLRQEP